MQLKRLKLTDFRNHTHKELEFGEKINMVWGPNAVGKTSVLEAIYLLTIGRSFRTNRPADMVRHEAELFRVEAEFVRNDIDHHLVFASDGKQKRILYNHRPCASVAHLLELLQCVVVAPDDDLISGLPQNRRFFLDLLISQMDPLYLHNISRYQKALKQRNQLLKDQISAGIEPWETEMAKSAVYVVDKRGQVIDSLNKKLERIYPHLSGEVQDMSLHFRSKLMAGSAVEDYLKDFRENRAREFILGTSLVGPHRDDVRTCIGHDDARTFASEGQKRTCVVALRLSSWECLKEVANEPPLMLIDDIGANLDKSRRDRLVHYTTQLGQVFITSTIQPQDNSKVYSVNIHS
ncbi:MAG: DNA replication/repair protein RecF [Pseudobdellovibrionaceae bacterium]